jgi:hypothetical protein
MLYNKFISGYIDCFDSCKLFFPLSILVDYLSLSECDPLQFQAAKELGSLSQKRRPALQDLTNRFNEEVPELNSPIRAAKKQEFQYRSLLTPELGRRRASMAEDSWLSRKFPAKLALMKRLQTDQHRHVFEIENRRLSHIGAMPTPKRSSSDSARKPTKYTFRFTNEI